MSTSPEIEVQPGNGAGNKHMALIRKRRVPGAPYADIVLGVPWEQIPQLITDLRRAYNAWKTPPEQSDADGVVTAILHQSHVAAAPGDFS